LALRWLSSTPSPQHCTLCTGASEDASEGESGGTDFLQPLRRDPRNNSDLGSAACLSSAFGMWRRRRRRRRRKVRHPIAVSQNRILPRSVSKN